MSVRRSSRRQLPETLAHRSPAFQLRIRSEKVSLLAARKNLETEIAEQRKRLLRVRKDCKILENLKDRRKKAWTYLSDREIENTAAESYISNWARSNAESQERPA